MIEKYKALEAKYERLKALNVELTAKCNWYNGDGARLERERDELTRQHEAYVKMLGELLAVLHADGGHYRYEHGTEKAVADAITKYYELVKQLAEYKADAAKWRAHQKRKQEVIAAGMGRKILRDLETHDALPAFYAAMKEASAEPVYYEYRAWFGENTVKPGWGDWERVKPRDALCTIDDAVNELQQYISAGYKYQLRELYEHPPAMKGATNDANI